MINFSCEFENNTIMKRLSCPYVYRIFNLCKEGYCIFCGIPLKVPKNIVRAFFGIVKRLAFEHLCYNKGRFCLIITKDLGVFQNFVSSRKTKTCSTPGVSQISTGDK